jgi:trigger factor
VPPLDEAFARAFGIASGNVADLRAEVEANLKLELKRKIDTVLKDQALSGLRAQAQFALPKSLVDIEARGLAARSAENMKQHGAKPEQINLDPDMFRRQAEDRVALGLIVGEMVRREGLQAKPEQVRALVQETAQTYEQPEAVVRWHYEKRERLADFEALAVEKNVVDWVMARARVTETPTSFEAIMMPSGG